MSEAWRVVAVPSLEWSALHRRLSLHPLSFISLLICSPIPFSVRILIHLLELAVYMGGITPHAPFVGEPPHPRNTCMSSACGRAACEVLLGVELEEGGCLVKEMRRPGERRHAASWMCREGLPADQDGG